MSVWRALTSFRVSATDTRRRRKSGLASVEPCEESILARQVVVLRIERRNDPRGPTHDVASGHESKVTRVGTVVAVVAEHEIHAFRHDHGTHSTGMRISEKHDLVFAAKQRFAQEHRTGSGSRGEELLQVGGIPVGVLGVLAVDGEPETIQLDHVAWEPHHAL